MHSQPDLKELILAGGAGREVKLEELPGALIEIFETPSLRKHYATACEKLAESVQGSSQRTFAHIFK
jgi:hypothetical protein